MTTRNPDYPGPGQPNSGYPGPGYPGPHYYPLVPADPQSHQLAPYDPYRVEQYHDDELDLHELWNTVLKYRWTILSFLLIVVMTTVAANYLMRPVYQATTLIEVKPPKGLVKFQNVEEAQNPQREFMETQANILRSESVADAVIQNLDLENHPEYNGKLAQRGVVAGIRQIIGVLMPKSDADDLASAESLKGMVPGSPEYEALKAERGRITQFGRNLKVAAIRNSNLFEVTFNSFFPQTAANAANMVAREYLRLNDERRFNSTSGAKDFLEKEITRIQAKLETSEKELNEFARKRQIVDVEDRGNVMQTRLQELNENLTRVQDERIAAETLVQQVRSGAIESIPEVMQDPLVGQLKEEYAQLQSEYVELSKIYKEKYPRLQQLKAKRDEIALSLDLEVGRITRSVEGSYARLVERERLLEAAVEDHKQRLLDLQDRAVQYNILKREWETNKELYTGLLERMKEVGVAAGMELNNISVIDEAAVPVNPAAPRKLRNIAIGGVLGLFGGIGLAFLLAYLDKTVRTPDQLEKATHLASLGMVPKFKGKAVDKAYLDTISHNARDSEVAEAFRSIRTSLMFSAPGGAPKTLMFTSSMSSEGKTTSGINLAIVLAQNGAKVLMVDGDLRKPRLHKAFGLPLSPGLSEYLVGDEGNWIYETSIPNLNVLTAGTLPPNPAELLGSGLMSENLEKARLRDQYDHIIVDAPPVLGLADPMIISTKVDAVILVANSGTVSIDAVKDTVKRLRSIRAPLLGTVLNMVDFSNREYGYYNRYYYQYGENESKKRSSRSKDKAPGHVEAA